MSNSFRLRLFSFTIYAILLAGIAFESFSIVRKTGIVGKNNIIRTCNINIEGNVRKPGWYLVPEGTTQFEILQVAGIRLTSDITTVILSSQLNNNEKIHVGTLDKPVVVSDRKEYAVVDVFFGEGQNSHTEGNTTSIIKGSNIIPGDRIKLNAASQAEISLSSFSKIDLDNFSDITFEKINQSFNSQSVTEITQNTGSCWHRIVYSNTDELFRVYTRSVILTVVGSGADFLLDVQNDQVVLNLYNGLLLVERRAGGESTNLISGQSATIYDDSRPFQISKLSPDISVNEEFTQLINNKSDYLLQDVPLNVFFSVTPNIFYLAAINFKKVEITLIRIPESLLIEKFTNNLSTLDQAYLYGGSIFVTTFLERIFDCRVQKYMACSKESIKQISDILGGITVDIDSKAAAYLNISKGSQKLTSTLLSQYLSPSVSGIPDSKVRQSQVLKAIFDGLLNKNVVPTLVTADQIVNSNEANLSAQELFEYFSKFIQRNNWVYKELIIPSRIVNRETRTCFDPIIEDCRRIVNND
jgi:hypothetical protein